MGFDCCLLAFGMTNAGKTHTIIGSKENPGLMFKIFENMFDKLSPDDPKATDPVLRRMSRLSINNFIGHYFSVALSLSSSKISLAIILCVSLSVLSFVCLSGLSVGGSFCLAFCLTLTLTLSKVGITTC
jgi:hypothetical protein